MHLLLTAALAADPVAAWTAHAAVDAVDRDGVSLTVTWTAKVTADGATLDCTALDWAAGAPPTCLTAAGAPATWPAIAWRPDDVGLALTLNDAEVARITPLSGRDVVVGARALGEVIAATSPTTWSPEPAELKLVVVASPATVNLQPYGAEGLARAAWTRPDDALTAWQCAAAEVIDPAPLTGPALTWWIRAAAVCTPTPTLFSQRDDACDIARARARLTDEERTGCAEGRDNVEWSLAEAPFYKPPRVTWPAGVEGEPVTCRGVVHLDARGAVQSTDLEPACPEAFHAAIHKALFKARAAPYIYHGVAKRVRAPIAFTLTPP